MDRIIPDDLKLSIFQWEDILFNHKPLILSHHYNQYSNHDLFLKYSSCSVLDFSQDKQYQFWQERPYENYQSDKNIEKIIYLKRLGEQLAHSLDLLLYFKNLKSYTDIANIDVSKKDFRDHILHDLSILLTKERVAKFVQDLQEEKSALKTEQLLIFIKKTFKPKQYIDYYLEFEKTINTLHSKLETNLIYEHIDNSHLKTHKKIVL